MSLEQYMNNYNTNTTWYNTHTTDRLEELMKIIRSSDMFKVCSYTVPTSWLLEVRQQRHRTAIPTIRHDETFDVYSISEDEARCIIISDNPFYSHALVCNSYIGEVYHAPVVDDREIVEYKIGLIAYSIRGNWQDITWRLKKIRSLCYQIGRTDLVQEIDDGIEDIYYDGRWFRDEWSGPYGTLPMNKSHIYKDVRPLMKELCEYGCCTIYEYDIEYSYKSKKVHTYGLLATKIRDDRANVTQDDIDEFKRLAKIIDTYYGPEDLDVLIKRCPVFYSE